MHAQTCCAQTAFATANEQREKGAMHAAHGAAAAAAAAVKGAADAGHGNIMSSDDEDDDEVEVRAPSCAIRARMPAACARALHCALRQHQIP